MYLGVRVEGFLSKFARRHTNSLFLLVLLFGFTFFFQNCAKQPSVELLNAKSVSLSSMSYTHTGTETSCKICHEKQRPKVTASGAPHDQAQDCMLCHSSGTTWVGVSKFEHTTLTANDSCVTCHATARPIGFVGIAPNQFNHSTPEGQTDCKYCHTQTAGVTWKGGLFKHSPTPSTCATCHTADRPIATVKVPAGANNNVFLHNTQFMGSLDCATCHAQDQNFVGVSWTGGNFNHKQPGTNTTINTCQTCHEGKRPTVLVGANFNHTTNGQGDCVSCHLSGAGVSWSTGQYHKVGAAIPTACQSCHISSRPGPTVILPSILNNKRISAFLHDTKYIGTRDCVACHANNTTNKANVGKNWSAAYYDHKNPTNLAASISTCQDCHRDQRTPGVPQGASGYNHSNGGMGDCVDCHNQPGIKWAGAASTFNHSPVPASCATCHENKRPASGVYYPSATSTNRFRHLIAYGGTGDCKSCHYSSTANKANLGKNWTSGDYTHMDLSGVIIKTCLDCHQIRGNREHCSTKNVTQECYQCHNRSTQSATNSIPSMNWSKSIGGNPTCK